MTAGDLAAVLVAAVTLGLMVVLTVVATSLIRAMRELRSVLDELHQQTLPLVTNLRVTVEKAEVDLVRVEGILDSAERISTTVDAATRLTYRAFSPPLIKTLSLMAGLRQAKRRNRRR